MVNTGTVAVATVQTPGGASTYEGDARIDGVPGTAAPIPLEFRDTAGSICGALLPTGNAVDVIDGVDVHADRQRHAGRRARSAPTVGATGYEPREALDARRRAEGAASRRSASRPAR